MMSGMTFFGGELSKKDEKIAKKGLEMKKPAKKIIFGFLNHTCTPFFFLKFKFSKSIKAENDFLPKQSDKEAPFVKF
jgi:hypothetical protein